MAHPGVELTKYLKANGGKRVEKDGYHEVWELEGKRFRIAVAGRRPTHIVRDLKRQAQGLVRRKQARLKANKKDLDDCSLTEYLQRLTKAERLVVWDLMGKILEAVLYTAPAQYRPR